MRPIAITLLAFAMSCTKQDAADQLFPHEEHAIAIASAKCQCSSEMPWLRDMIRQADAEDKYKGVIYAIEYSNGVAFMHQPWISSCYACLVFDCEGNAASNQRQSHGRNNQRRNRREHHLHNDTLIVYFFRSA